MLPATNQPNLADLSYLMALSDDEAARQRAIIRARHYHAGMQFVKLTERLRQFLRDTRGLQDYDCLRLNVCRTVVQALVERLLVSRFECADADQAATAWQWWQRNRMDVAQDETHEATIRDGESFVIVSWDNDAQIPRFVPHPRYTDAQLDTWGTALHTTDSTGVKLDGDGFGCKAFYPDDDMSQPMAYATKRWMEIRLDRGKRTTRQRLNIYYPDRIEKYVLRGAGTERVLDDGDTQWPIPWVDRQGKPLGIPVIHFRNAGMRCEAWEAIPLQNAINKSLIDMLTAGDYTAFRIFVALGFIPTTDGKEPKADRSNWLTLEPGQIIGSAKGKADASFDAIEGEDLAKLIAPINQLIYWTAMVTDTPVSRFITTAQVAAEGTLKQQEGPLVNKARKRQTLLGNGWEDCISLGRRLHNTYTSAPAMDEGQLFAAAWEPAETRDEAAELEGLALKREKLMVPLAQLWREAGYSEEQIARMQAERAAEQQAQQVMIRSTQQTTPQELGGRAPA